MLFEERIWAWFLRVGERIDDLRARRGDVVAAAVMASILMLLAMIYVRPSLPFFPANMTGGNEEYLAIVQDPFNYDHTVGARGYRLAVPLLSWAIGLRGVNLAYTTLLLALLFQFSLFYKSFRDGFSSTAALAIASAFAFAGGNLYNILDTFTVEVTRIFVCVLMVFTARRPLLFWALFLVSLFVHEGGVLYLPFCLLLRWPHRRSLGHFLVIDGLAALVIVAFFMRFFSQTHHAGYLLGFSDGLSGFLQAVKANVRKWAWFAYDGTFAGLKLYWLPVLAAIGVAVRDRRVYDTLLLLAPIGTFAVMMVVSWETTRFAMLAQPSVLIAFYQLRQRFGEETTARTFLILGLISLFVPQQVSLGGPLGPMPSLPHLLLFWAFGGNG